MPSVYASRRNRKVKGYKNNSKPSGLKGHVVLSFILTTKFFSHGTHKVPATGG